MRHTIFSFRLAPIALVASLALAGSSGCGGHEKTAFAGDNAIRVINQSSGTCAVYLGPERRLDVERKHRTRVFGKLPYNAAGVTRVAPGKYAVWARCGHGIEEAVDVTVTSGPVDVLVLAYGTSGGGYTPEHGGEVVRMKQARGTAIIWGAGGGDEGGEPPASSKDDDAHKAPEGSSTACKPAGAVVERSSDCCSANARPKNKHNTSYSFICCPSPTASC